LLSNIVPRDELDKELERRGPGSIATRRLQHLRPERAAGKRVMETTASFTENSSFASTRPRAQWDGRMSEKFPVQLHTREAEAANRAEVDRAGEEQNQGADATEAG